MPSSFDHLHTHLPFTSNQVQTAAKALPSAPTPKSVPFDNAARLVVQIGTALGHAVDLDSAAATSGCSLYMKQNGQVITVKARVKDVNTTTANHAPAAAVKRLCF